MTSSELSLIKKYILGAKNYLEFGSGNSTIIAEVDPKNWTGH
jgi:hypothetical protein